MMVCPPCMTVMIRAEWLRLPHLVGRSVASDSVGSAVCRSGSRQSLQGGRSFSISWHPLNPSPHLALSRELWLDDDELDDGGDDDKDSFHRDGALHLLLLFPSISLCFPCPAEVFGAQKCRLLSPSVDPLEDAEHKDLGSVYTELVILPHLLSTCLQLIRTKADRFSYCPRSLKSKTKPSTFCDGGRPPSTTCRTTCWARSCCRCCRWWWWCRWGCCWGCCCWCRCYCCHCPNPRTQPGAVQRFQRGPPLLRDVLPPPPPRLDGGGWGAEADKASPHPPLPPHMSSPPPPPLLLHCFYSM